MKVKNLILTVAIVLSMTIGMAQTVISSGSCGATVTYVLTSDSTLTISGTGAMTSFSANNMPWNSYRNMIKTIIIEDNVTTIGTYAFNSCSALTSVSLPNTLTHIEDRAFYNSALTQVTIPYSVADIRIGAFRNCSRLTSIDVDVSNTNYSSENGILFDIAKTILIQYPASKTEATYIIPNSVTQIRDYAFVNCRNLTLVTIPSSRPLITAGAFSGCSNLTAIISHAAAAPSLSGSDIFNSVPANIPIYIPCGTSSSYLTGWSGSPFTNYIEAAITQHYLANMCQGSTYSDSYFTDLTEAGTFFDTLQTVNGCDSVVCLTLGYFYSTSVTNYAESICQGSTYSDNHFTGLTEAERYTLPDVNGCDSIVLTLTVNPLPNATITQNGSELISSTATNYQWYLNNEPIPNAIAQNYICTQNGIYFVEVGNEYGCFAKSNEISITNVGISEITVGNIRIYPNPANDLLYIDCKRHETHVEDYQIFNITGISVMSGKLQSDNSAINVKLLPKGVYYIKVSDKIMKFVKM